MRLPLVLACDDDPTIHILLKEFLQDRFQFQSSTSAEETLSIIKNKPVDVLLLDLFLRKPGDGLQLIPKLRDADPDLPIIIISAKQDFDTVREALRCGVFDFISKEAGLSADEVVHTIDRALENRRLKERQTFQNREVARAQSEHNMIGKSPVTLKLLENVEKIKRSSANVLISGETGTGKEVVARLLRTNIEDGTLCPFVAIDSSTIQSSTAESILFGHEKGAFTGADKQKKGVFEEANGGIVYFDEIANMPLEIQAKLLRVLQEKEITRLGSTKMLKLDFRVICATNRKLDELVKEGHFKDDLYQRLNVLPIQLPPLRSRKEDIDVLIEHFTHRHAPHSKALSFTDEARAALHSYDWPGNVREVSNLVAYVITMAGDGNVTLQDLPPQVVEAYRPQDAAIATAMDCQTFYDKVKDFEYKLLKTEFSQTNQNVRELAHRLGMDRAHLYRKLKEFGIFPAMSKNQPN